LIAPFLKLQLGTGLFKWKIKAYEHYQTFLTLTEDNSKNQTEGELITVERIKRYISILSANI